VADLVFDLRSEFGKGNLEAFGHKERKPQSIPILSRMQQALSPRAVPEEPVVINGRLTVTNAIGGSNQFLARLDALSLGQGTSGLESLALLLSG
jgi:hypothetical protein